MLHPLFQATFAVAAALTAAGFVANTNAAAGDFACGVATSTKGNMMTIEGQLLSPTDMAGDYRFALKSSGTNVSQGGQFSAAAKAQVSLGQVMINAGSHVSVDFTVTTGGKTFDCSQNVTRT